MSDTVKELKEKLFYEKKNGLLKADENTLEMTVASNIRISLSRCPNKNITS